MVAVYLRSKDDEPKRDSATAMSTNSSNPAGPDHSSTAFTSVEHHALLVNLRVARPHHVHESAHRGSAPQFAAMRLDHRVDTPLPGRGELGVLQRAISRTETQGEGETPPPRTQCFGTELVVHPNRFE